MAVPDPRFRGTHVFDVDAIIAGLAMKQPAAKEREEVGTMIAEIIGGGRNAHGSGPAIGVADGLSRNGRADRSSSRGCVGRILQRPYQWIGRTEAAVGARAEGP